MPDRVRACWYALNYRNTRPLMVNEEYRGLVYPRKAQWAAASLEVAPGVWWVRFEMPGGLDHINIWLLEEEGGWTVVDA